MQACECDYSEDGFTLTRSFEGLRLQAYRDCAGVLTIGYGHTGPDVHEGQCITQQQAELLLQQDMAAAIRCVRHAVQVPISQNQFDALVDFCYNVGGGNLVNSTLLRYVNGSQFDEAAAQFGAWVHAGGAVAEGLVRRRAAEAALFTGGGCQPSPPAVETA